MLRAIELARHGMGRGDGGPFGAVVARDGEIVGEGWNRVVGANDPTAHGEISAIRDACTRLSTFSLAGCTIYTTCEPCPMCLGAIYWSRLAGIRFGFRMADAAALGFDDRSFYRELALPHDQRSIPAVELLRGEALVLTSEYLTLPGRPVY